MSFYGHHHRYRLNKANNMPKTNTKKPHPTAPNWQYESQYSGFNAGPITTHIAGVDEAGRGPLAGPVVCAAVILNPNNLPSGLNDSKKLSAPRRAELAAQIHQCAWVGVGISEPFEIERTNILAATLIAMGRAIADLPICPQVALIDGNKAPALAPHIEIQTIVKGDAKSLSIAAASIIAKTERDQLMALAHDRFPPYGFAGHKAYPTKAHRQTIMSIGACPLHRRTFAPIKDL